MGCGTRWRRLDKADVSGGAGTFGAATFGPLGPGLVGPRGSEFGTNGPVDESAIPELVDMRDRTD